MLRNVRLENNARVLLDFHMMGAQVIGRGLNIGLGQIAQRTQMEHDASILAKADIIGRNLGTIGIGIGRAVQRDRDFQIRSSRISRILRG